MTYIVLLYGSGARGDADQLSDRDILRVDHSANGAATYSWDDVAKMHSYGSLFLQHLKLEARVLDADGVGAASWAELMRTLPPYGRCHQDLSAFALVASDIEDALTTGDSTLQYESAVAARLIRHLAILACYIAGSPNFTRYGCLDTAAAEYGLIVPESLTFAELYSALQQPERFGATASNVMDWVHLAKELISAARIQIEENGVRYAHP